MMSSMRDCLWHWKCLIIDLDELSNLTRKQNNDVKELITKQPLTFADSLGNFRIEYLEPNKKYVIEISAFGYGKQKFEVETKSGINNLTFELKADCEYNAEQAESDWKNGKPKLLLFGSIAPIGNTPSDNRFEKKFRIKYYDFGCEPPIDECIKIYNN